MLRVKCCITSYHDPVEQRGIVGDPYSLDLPSFLVTSGTFMNTGLFQSLDMFLYEQNPRVCKCNGFTLEIIHDWNMQLMSQLYFHSVLDEEASLIYRWERRIIFPFNRKVFTVVVIFGSVHEMGAGLNHGEEMDCCYFLVHFNLIRQQFKSIKRIKS